jgi:hypothetical protein
MDISDRGTGKGLDHDFATLDTSVEEVIDAARRSSSSGRWATVGGWRCVRTRGSSFGRARGAV